MIITIGIILCLTFVFLSAMHFYWAVGGRWGSESVFPTTDAHTKAKMPGALPTLLVALGLLCFGVFYLIKVHLINIQLPLWISNYGLWILAGIFLLRSVGDFKYVGIFKKIKNTLFGLNDTKYYTPLCLIIAVLTGVVAFNV